MYFGGEAVTGRETQVYQALKMDVAREEERPASADGEMSASDVFTLFLAWTMRESRQWVRTQVGASSAPRTTYSVGAPIDQIDQDDRASPLVGVFNRLAFQAWRLSEGLEQGIALTDARKWIAAVKAVDVPPTEEQLIEVCAESSANVAGYALRPDVEEGLYAVVDIGAWTTEVAFFRLTDVAMKTIGKRRLAFYAGRSHRVATGKIDELCAKRVREKYSCANLASAVMDVIREEREKGSNVDFVLPVGPGGQEIPVPGSFLADARDAVAKELRCCFVTTLREAFQKEKQEEEWKQQLRVLLAGGGSFDDQLGRSVHHRFVWNSRVVPTPSNIEGLPNNDDSRRFLVAYGLANGQARWPDEMRPSEVEPSETPTMGPRPTSEDLGYDNP